MRWLVPLPVVLPLLVCAGLVAAAPVCRRRIADSVTLLSALVVTATCGFLARASAQNTIVYWFGDWTPRGPAAIGISFTIDPLGAATAAFSGFLVVMALIYAWEYFDAVRTYFHALMLLFLAAMAGFCLTGDLFNLFVFFELMGVVAYALTGYKVEETQALAGSMNFAVTNSIGAFLLLIAIGLIYGRTGALNLAQAGLALREHPVDRLVIVALALTLSGLFVKAAVVPFHFWLADAHAVAPTPVCVLFSGIMIELGLYGSFRIYWTVFHPSLHGAEARIRLVLLSLGALTAVLGGVMCLCQRHLKRLLAFSSISHVGMILAGAACLSAKGIGGAALYVLGHGCVKGALFLCVGILLHRFGSLDEAELFARGRKLVVLGSTFAISGLGLAGFPPFGTYLGKQLMEEAGAAIDLHWLPWLFLFASAVTGGAVLRVAGRVFLGWGDRIPEKKRGLQAADREEQETRKEHHKTPLIMMIAAILLALTPLASAFIGSALGARVEAAGKRFINQTDYAAAVLQDRPTGAILLGQPVRATGRGLVFGFAAAAGALGVALLALFQDRIGNAVRRVRQSVWNPVVTGLSVVHSGHIGDLIVWLTMGVVVIGVSLAIAVGFP